jgi:CheY-like chemotaxis protein
MAHVLEESARLGRFTPAQLEVLLNRLDAMEEQSQDRKRRKTPRYPYRRPELALHITQPGGGTHDCRVHSRNLSAAGMSILYTGFLYNGTEVAVRLKKQHGGEETVQGNVAWCRHIAGSVHSIGIKFKTRIFAKLFIDPSMMEPGEQGERVDPSIMEGAVLMIEDQLMDRLLFQHQVGATHIKADTVPTVEEALEKIAAGTAYDIVLSDLNLTEMKGEEAFKQIRGVGYKGAMIAVTAETAPNRIQAAQAAGAAAIIRKPYDFDVLMTTLAAFLKDGDLTAEQLIHSTMAAKPEFAPVLAQYVDGVKGLAVSLKQALDQGDFEQVRAKCQTLKGSGTGFGFAQLSDAAKEAGRMLDTTRSVAESATLIESLLQICRRMTAQAA